MKKYTLSLFALLIFTLVSCGDKTDNPQPDNNSPTNPTTPPTPRVYATVSTFVGSNNNTWGAVTNGTGTAARFDGAFGAAFDSQGNLFIADFYNHVIRKATPSGVVTTFAGSGTAGRANGTGTNAQFNRPYGICIDASDNLYVVDTENHAIRKITPTGVVTDFAGGGGNSLAGEIDGTGTAARFAFPIYITMDKNGNFYVTESSSASINKPRVRKITSAGVVTVFAPMTQTPRGICVDNDNNVYVNTSFTIQKITPAGVVSVIAGNASVGGLTDGTGVGARFRSNNGMALDRFGNLFVSDEYRIRKIRLSDVQVTTLTGTNTAGDADGALATATFRSLGGVVLDKNDILYVGQRNNIRKVE